MELVNEELANKIVEGAHANKDLNVRGVDDDKVRDVVISMYTLGAVQFLVQENMAPLVERIAELEAEALKKESRIIT